MFLLCSNETQIYAFVKTKYVIIFIRKITETHI